MKKKHNRWVDKNNNSWCSFANTKKEAKTKSKILINCYNCSDCSDCAYCTDCSRCSRCSRCSDCFHCTDLL